MTNGAGFQQQTEEQRRAQRAAQVRAVQGRAQVSRDLISRQAAQTPQPVVRPSGRLSIQPNIVRGATPGGQLTRAQALAPLRVSAQAGGVTGGATGQQRFRATDAQLRTGAQKAQALRPVEARQQVFAPTVGARRAVQAEERQRAAATRAGAQSALDKGLEAFTKTLGIESFRFPTARGARTTDPVLQTLRSGTFADIPKAQERIRELFSQTEEGQRLQGQIGVTEAPAADIQQRTRQLATTGGVGRTVEDLETDKTFATEVADVLGLAENTEIRRTSDGRIEIVGADIELDPFKRAQTRTETLRTRALGDVGRQFGEAQNRIIERFSFRTGPRAGELTEQGKDAMQKLLTSKNRIVSRTEEDFKFRQEGLVLEEAGNQQKIEAQQRAIEKETAGQRIKRLSDEAILNNAQDIQQQTGLDFAAALDIARDQANKAGDAFNVNRVKTLEASGEINTADPLGYFQKVNQLTNGNTAQTRSTIAALNGDAFADLAQESFLAQQGLDADTIQRNMKLDKLSRQRATALSPDQDPLGTDFISLYEELGKVDETGFNQRLLLEELRDADVPAAVRVMGELLREDVAEEAEFDIRTVGKQLIAVNPRTLEVRTLVGGSLPTPQSQAGGTSVGGGGSFPNLSTLDRVAAKGLSVEIYGKRAGTKEENVNEILSLLNEGMTIDSIGDELRNIQASTAFEGTFRNAFEFASSGLPAERAGRSRDSLDRLVEAGDDPRARDFILKIARDAATADERKQATGRDDAIKSVEAIEKALDDFVAAGGDTGLVTGTVEGFKQKVLRKTGDQELARLSNEIAIAIQTYRKAISGAAFTESEAKEYANIFPSIGKSPELNKAKIDSLRTIFDRNQTNFYKRQIGDRNYDDLFSVSKAAQTLQRERPEIPRVDLTQQSFNQAQTQLQELFPDRTDFTDDELIEFINL